MKEPTLVGEQVSSTRRSARLSSASSEKRAPPRLDHPNICAVHDIGEHEGQPYIVMPLLRGQNLKERILARRLKVEEVLEYAIQIAARTGEMLGAASLTPDESTLYFAQGTIEADIWLMTAQ